MKATKQLMLFSFMAALGSTIGFAGGWEAVVYMWGLWIAIMVRLAFKEQEEDIRRQRMFQQ